MLAAGGLIGGMLAAWVVASSADPVNNLKMEMDGNTAAPSASTYDWESFFQGPAGTDINETSGALPTGFIARGETADYALPDVSTFATGSKDTLNIGSIPTPKKTAAGWQCGNSNNLGAKDDLVNVYTVAYRDPTTHHLFLYFGAEKSSNLGDNNIGIWFLQDPGVGCTLSSNGRNTDFQGHHLPGDVLLTAAFTNGGTQATVESHLWMAGTANGGEGSLGPADGGFFCTGGGATIDHACAITNTADINPPWNHPVKTPGADGVSLAPQEFYEGGVDVTQLAIDAATAAGTTPVEPCITKFVADTRSSQSPTATLFDYAIGGFPVCSPKTSLAASPTVASPGTIHSGGSQTFTFSETNTGDVTLTDPSVTTDTSGCSPAYVSGDTGATAGSLDPGETWVFTCTVTNITSTLTVVGTGHGYFSDGVHTKDVTACTTSDDTHICMASEQASAKVVVINPSTTMANSSTAGSPATAHAGDTITFTFKEKNDGDVDLTNVYLASDDAGCNSTLAYVSGDATPRDNTLSAGAAGAGEEWTFQCTTSFSAAGSKTVTVFGHGTDPLGADVTFYPTAVGATACSAGAIDASTPPRLCDLQERATASVTIINPSTELREGVSAVVTFTYYEKNTGDSVISGPSVTSTACPGPTGATPVLATGTTHNIGDTADIGNFNPGETWQFTCTKTVNGTAAIGTASDSYTDTGTGHGTDAAGSAVPSNGETDSSTVTLTNNAPNAFSS
ncbi:MAG TPA: hypothetical protein VHN98_13150 [Acidimicrobiales bacterium]|nr:hypothetical protein [Acidimicrobiales bacterium]